MVNNQRLDSFLFLFFNNLQQLLNSEDSKRQLYKLQLHVDEANTDRPLKCYLKDFILNNSEKIHKNIKDYTLIFDSDKKEQHIEDINFEVFDIRLSDDLSEEEISNFKSEGQVYTRPDLIIELKDTITYKITPLPVELKTTKKDVIPGSSVQQINGNEWVIFIKIPNKQEEVETIIGKYVWAINQKIQFPDRSPRPSISFNSIKSWTNTYIKEQENKLIVESPADLLEQKKIIIEDWHKILVNRWLDEIKKEKPSRGWFNEVIRRYTQDLLNYYNNLPKNEQIKLISRLGNKKD